jgi:hypothetical protein
MFLSDCIGFLAPGVGVFSTLLRVVEQGDGGPCMTTGSLRESISLCNLRSVLFAASLFLRTFLSGGFSS